MSFKSQHYLQHHLPKLWQLSTETWNYLLIWEFDVALCVCLWVSVDDDPQGWTAIFEHGVVFPALLSAALGVFTMDVWLILPGCQMPSSCSWGLCPFPVFLARFPGSALAAGQVLPSLAQAFPGAEGLSCTLYWGCCSCVRCGSSRQSPFSSCCSSILTAAPRCRQRCQCLSLAGEGFMPVLQHLLPALGTSLALPWLRGLLCCCRTLQAALKATCGTACRCRTSREEQLCLQAVSSQAVLAKQ